MNIGKKLAIGTVSLAAVIGGAFYLQNEVKSKANGFAQSVDKVAEVLPKGFTQEHKQDVGFFSTSGEYTLFVENEDKTKIDVLTMDYTMKHNLLNILSSKYPLTSNLFLNWNELPGFDVPMSKEAFYKFDGVYLSNGSLDMAGKAQDMTVDMEDKNTAVNVIGNQMSINYNKETGETRIKNTVDKIVDNQAGEEINNLALMYSYDVEEGKNVGKFDFTGTIEKVQQGYAEFEGIKFSLNGAENEKFLDSGVSLKVDKISSVLAGDKTFSFDMEMTLTDLSASLYRRLTQLTDLDSLSEAQSEELVTLMKDMVDEGFKLDITRLNITDSKDELKSKFSLYLSPKVGDEDFIKRVDLGADVYLKSPFISSTIRLVPSELRGLMVDKVNEISFDYKHLKGVSTLNGRPMPKEYGEIVNETLLGLELTLDDFVTDLIESIRNHEVIENV